MEEAECTPTMPEELRVRPRDSPLLAPGAFNGTSAAASVRLLDGAEASLDGVLLRKRWAIHWMSRMYHFRRPELSTYAHELVKFLRGEALTVFQREFGYKVSIRHTDAFVAFEVQEEREAKDAHLAPVLVIDSSAAGIPSALGRPLGNGTGSNRGRTQAAGMPPPPSFAFGAVRSAGSSGFDLHTIANSGVNGSSSSDVNDVDNGSWLRASESESKPSAAAVTTSKVRRGGFVLYFPRGEEDEQQLRASMAQRKTKERQYVVLLRGHEGLLRWACAWLQQRFQCIVSERQMAISPLNLKWLARNWVVDSLARTSNESNSTVSASSGDEAGGKGDDAARAPPQPLLLKYQSLEEQSMVRNYTLTVPWATLRRLMEQEPRQTVATAGAEGGGGVAESATPDLIQRTEELYFETLPLNMSAFELTSIEMGEAAVDHNGHLELYDLSLVHSVLRGLAELLCIQNVPGPASPVVTL